MKDNYCTSKTPVLLGQREPPTYGKSIKICPRIAGKQITPYEQKSYLKELLPLEEYDVIIVLLSGGKDSVACLLKLLELGVPPEKIECWHHDIDGGHPTRRMDWPVTQSYIRALCAHLGVKLALDFALYRKLVHPCTALYVISFRQFGTLPAKFFSLTSGFLQIPPHDGHPCLRLALPATERAVDFHHQVIAHAGRTIANRRGGFPPRRFVVYRLSAAPCKYPSARSLAFADKDLKLQSISHF